MQKMIYDKANPAAIPIPVGEPYPIPAAMKISMGGGNEKVRSQIVTDESGNSSLINLDTGAVIKELGKKGKPSATYEKAQQAKKQLGTDLDTALENLDMLIGTDKNPGLLKKATGSGAGAVYDAALGVFGKATEGAIAGARVAPLADPILKLVPRFEGPQSDKDTASYKEAAGNLANPAIPAPQKLAAAATIRDIIRRRKGQFVGAGSDTWEDM
jgi:hypothetical protein